MFHKLTEYVFAVCDLIEAEVRALRAVSRRVALGGMIMLLAAALLATSFGFLIAGVYILLATALNAWAGALITGGIVLVMGALATWIALQTIR